MHRIAIITSDLAQDYASQELLEAANELAIGSSVDPISFGMNINDRPMLQIGTESLDTFDGFIMRGFNRTGESDFQYEFLELLQKQGKLLINSPEALSIAESKAQTTFCLQKAGLPVPRTLVTHSIECALDALNSFGKSVLKPLYGSHGDNMKIVTPANGAKLLPEFFKKNRVIYMQEFIPNDGKDIRAFVIGDDVPAAIYRIARKGDWRTNVAKGSTCAVCELTPKIRELCIEATRVIGLDYTGVDVMEGPDGPVILEVNGAPWWHGLLEATGRNVAFDIIEYMLRLLANGKPARRPIGF